MAAPLPRSTGWIGGPVYDGAFFFAPAVLAAGVGLVCLRAPALIPLLWWSWIALVDGPHLAASLLRTAGSPASRARYREPLRRSVGAFAVPLLFWAVDWLLPDRGAFTALLLVAAVASFYHLARQHYGIMRIFEARGDADAAARREDRRALAVALGAFAVLPLGLLPANRLVLGLPAPAPALLAAGWALLAAVGAYTLVYLVRALRARGGRRQAAWFVGGTVTPLLFLAYGWIGAREPLFRPALDAEHFLLVVTIMLGLQHGMEYLGIVFLVHSQRMPLKAYGICLGGTVIYLAVCAARGNSPAYAWLPLGSSEAKLCLAVYWGLFFQHYYLDQKIWRVARDAGLRKELGLAERTGNER